MHMQEALTRSLYVSVIILCAFEGPTHNTLAFNFKCGAKTNNIENKIIQIHDSEGQG